MITGTRRLLRLDSAQQLDAVHFGHPHVKQDYRRLFARNQIHHAGRGGRYRRRENLRRSEFLATMT